jgi:hypothetical protein
LPWTRYSSEKPVRSRYLSAGRFGEQSYPDLPQNTQSARRATPARPRKDREHRGYLGIEVDDALAIAEQVDVWSYRGRADPLCLVMALWW